MAIRLSTAIDRRQRIRRAAKFIEATIQDRPSARLPVSELAQVACMSPYHFIRRYTHAVGESPDASVRRLRLQAARRMLTASTLGTVTQVAFEVGYDSVAAFGRAYRRMFGIAPSADVQCDQQPAAVTWSAVDSPAIQLRALRIAKGGDVWSEFDELVGHLDVGAVPRPAHASASLRSASVGLGGVSSRRAPANHQARYLNDPAYCALPDQRISLFVPLVNGARLLVK